jgi:hypothetical protein
MTPSDSYANLTPLASAPLALPKEGRARLLVLLEHARLGVQDLFRPGERHVVLLDVIAATAGVAPDRSANIAKFMKRGLSIGTTGDPPRLLINGPAYTRLTESAFFRARMFTTMAAPVGVILA